MKYLLMTALTAAICWTAWDFSQWMDRTVTLPQPEAPNMKIIGKWNAVCRVEKCRNRSKRNASASRLAKATSKKARAES